MISNIISKVCHMSFSKHEKSMSHVIGFKFQDVIKVAMDVFKGPIVISPCVTDTDTSYNMSV